MLDTAERDKALTELQHERELRQKAEVEAAQMRLSCKRAHDEVKRLQRDLEQQRAMLAMAQAQSTSGAVGSSNSDAPAERCVVSPTKDFKLTTTVKLNDQGKCRVMCYCDSICTICVSQPSSNHLFPGFGLRLVSAVDLKPSQFIPLHAQAIRDVAFNSLSSLLLTASLDKTLKLTSCNSHNVVQT